MEPTYGTPKKQVITRAEEIKRRCDVLAELLVEGPTPPHNPFLRKTMTEAATRRLAARLRAGIVRPDDPGIDPNWLANKLDRIADYRRFLTQIANELNALDEMYWEEFRSACGKLYDDVDITLHV